MVRIKPFRGMRPPRDLVEQVESRPYDVLSSEEARAEATGNERSLYHIIRPEIDFPEGTDEHDPRVYQKAMENFRKFQQQGWLQEDRKEMYYIYAQTMNGKTQYGIVVAASVADYVAGSIKRHELTRPDKEEDRMKHIRNLGAHVEPVFFAYPDNQELDELVARYVAKEPEYDFMAPVDGFGHRFWLIDRDEDIARVTQIFAALPVMYIADGHHRSAASVRIGQEKARQNPLHTGDEEYNFFMAVCFPASQLTILEYNRLVRDLNGMDAAGFLKALETDFEVSCRGPVPYKPERKHEFSIYVAHNWYQLRLLPGRVISEDPIEQLDVTISSRLILDKILGIKDLRTDKRIEFVGGLRGLEELARRCDRGEMKLALALYPVEMSDIMKIADSGAVMPPKATWFEPKLRSGLIVHKFT